MAIKNSVGRGGINNRVDAKVIQAALNLINHPKYQLINKLTVDGLVGAASIAAIESFQKNVVGLTTVDGRVDKNGKTLASLRANILTTINEHSLAGIMAHADAAIVKPYVTLLNQTLNSYQINTRLRTAHFLAQIGHESLSFRYTEEIASGKAYEGRADLGNTQAGDGERFKGRGLIQLTGRANYTSYGSDACLDLLTAGNETMISNSPRYALDVALWFWQKRLLNNYADSDNLRAITKRVNGGYNGLVDRQAYLDRAKFFLVR